MSWYFKFQIPQSADGSVVTYSPGWCGTRAKCARNEKGLLYNDKELWGIGQADGVFVPDDVEVLNEKTALALLAEARDGEGIFTGEKLANRWNPEALVEDKVDVENTLAAGEVATRKAVFCPICHQFITWLPDNITAKSIQLICPTGHKVALNG